MGFVDRSAEGWTELRVHGVSGTAATEMLEWPDVEQVAGDRVAGFYRRRWEVQPLPSQIDGGRRRVEAYSWGGLTSGSASRAAWLLLLPFMLVNVAYWAAPWADLPAARERGADPAAPPRGTVALRRVWRWHGVVQRLLAMTLTAVFVLAVFVVAVDLVGWQCGNAGPTGTPCAGDASWLRFLDWSWLATPGRRLAITGVVPVAMVLLLWWLARRSWAETEQAVVPQLAPLSVQSPLEDRGLWNGKEAVANLRALHVTAAFSLIGLLLSVPALERPDRGLAGLWSNEQWAAPYGACVAGAALVCFGFLLLAVILLLPSGVARRPREEQSNPPWYRQARLPGIALAAAATTAGLLAVPAPGASDEIASAPGQLPWLGPTGTGVLLAQVALLLTSVGLVLALRVLGRREERRSKPALWGLAAPALATLGWMLAIAFSAGVGLIAAKALGTPEVAGVQIDTTEALLTLPTEYAWAAPAATVLLGWLLVVVAASGALLLRRRAQMTDVVRRVYGLGVDEARLKRPTSIRNTWTNAQFLARYGEAALGLFVAGAFAVAVAAVVLRFTAPSSVVEQAPWLIAWGVVVITAFLAGLWYVGRQAYANPVLRRSVGILWDLGTFWPRATHPLAPPCYAERTVPDLLCRIEYLAAPSGRDGRQRLLLSAHSQGAVIAAAVLLQVSTEQSARIGLLSYGSPLRRLYSRFFPAYFSEDALERLRGFLTDDLKDDSSGTRAWRWHNLYRLSDPIGGPVFPGSATSSVPSERVVDPFPRDGDIDVHLRDPDLLKAPGDRSWPPTRGHSNYFVDPAFAEMADALRESPGARGLSDKAPAGL